MVILKTDSGRRVLIPRSLFVIAGEDEYGTCRVVYRCPAALGLFEDECLVSGTYEGSIEQLGDELGKRD